MYWEYLHFSSKFPPYREIFSDQILVLYEVLIGFVFGEIYCFDEPIHIVRFSCNQHNLWSANFDLTMALLRSRIRSCEEFAWLYHFYIRTSLKMFNIGWRRHAILPHYCNHLIMMPKLSAFDESDELFHIMITLLNDRHYLFTC